MQKVKFEAETGAELRQQMLDFLGLDNQTTVHSTFVPLKDFAENPFKENAVQETKEETELKKEVETSTATRKRRTKAELEAEKAAENKVEDSVEDPANPETTDDTGVSETLARDNAEANAATKEPELTRAMVAEIVLEKGREGKKAKILAVMEEYTQADGTTKVTGLGNMKTEDYKSFRDKIINL